MIGVGNTEPFGLGNKYICFESVKKEVDAILEQEGVQELILNVNSPGGTPVQTDRISTYITEKAEAHGVPVVAFIEDVAASGITIIKCWDIFYILELELVLDRSGSANICPPQYFIRLEQ